MSAPSSAGLCVLLAGLLTPPAFAQEGQRAQDLKFGFTPVLSEPEVRAEFEPLMTYLSDAIGEKVTLYIAKDYGDLRTQMENGSVDIGSFSPFAYVDAARRGKIRIIASIWTGRNQVAGSSPEARRN